MGSAVFSQLTAESPYFTMGRPFLRQNCPFPWGHLDLHLIHDSLGPSNPQPNGISIGSAVFAWLTSVTDRPDRPTDHATRSVTTGRIYIRRTAMGPNNNP